MEDRFIEENVRHRLILSGISELEEHGIADFSLRRAAMGAQVSCAAPYRHFKSKEEYINEIIMYVGSKWELLSEQIKTIFENDNAAFVKELCIASLRFRIANRNFPLALAHMKGSGKTVDESIENAVREYCKDKALDSVETNIKCFTALAMIHGAVAMVDDDNSDLIFEAFKEKMNREFK